jgi:hypothetical protein
VSFEIEKNVFITTVIILLCDLGHMQLKAIINNVLDDNSSSWAATASGPVRPCFRAFHFHVNYQCFDKTHLCRSLINKYSNLISVKSTPIYATK